MTTDGNIAPECAVVRYGAHEFLFTHSDQRDHIFSVLKLSGGFYELELLEKFAHFLYPGAIVADVGANIGTHTVFAAGVCQASVVAFEPNLESAALLRRNIELNGLAQFVRIEQLGVGAKQGRASTNRQAAHNLGMTNLLIAPEGKVEVCRLDEIDFGGPLRLLKVDVEGMEQDVLEGAVVTIDRDHPVIAVEASDRSRFASIAALLRPFGYKLIGSFNWTPTHLFVSTVEPGFEKLDGSLMEALTLSRLECFSLRDSVLARLASVEAAFNDQSHRLAAPLARVETEVATNVTKMLSEIAGNDRERSKKVGEIDGRLVALSVRLSEGLSDVATQMQNLHRSQDELVVAKDRIAALEKGLHTAIAEADRTKVAAQAAAVRLRDLEGELVVTRSLGSQAQLAADAAAAQVSELQHALTVSNEQAEQRLATRAEELESAVAKYDALAASSSKTINDQGARIAELEQQMAIRLEELQRLTNLYNDATETIKSQQVALTSLQGDIVRERTHFEAAAARSIEQESRYQLLAERLQESEKTARASENSNRELKRSLRASRARGAKLASALQRTQSEFSRSTIEWELATDLQRRLVTGLEAISASRRWKVGNALGGIVDTCLLRRNVPRVMERLKGALDEYRAREHTKTDDVNSRAELGASSGQKQREIDDSTPLAERILSGAGLGAQPETGQVNVSRRPLVRQPKQTGNSAEHGAGNKEIALAANHPKLNELAIPSVAPFWRAARPVVWPSDGNIAASCAALARQMLREPDLAHHVIIPAPWIDRSDVGADRVNRAFVLIAHYRVFDPDFGAAKHPPWRVNCIADGELVLLSFPPVEFRPVSESEIREGGESATKAAQSSTLAVPTLEQFAAALRSDRGEVLVATTVRQLHALVWQICRSDRRRRREISALVSVLSYAPDLPSLVRLLALAVDRAVKAAVAAVSAKAAEFHFRRADTYAYAAFELSPKDVQTHLGPMIDCVLNASGASWILLCRGFRNSFLKGIALLDARPRLQRLIDATPTEDAAAFRIIQLAMGRAPVNSADASWLAHHVCGLSNSALVSLARDLRRTIPRFHNGLRDHSQQLIAAAESALARQGASAADRDTWMARCLVFLHSQAAGPRFVRWIDDNWIRLGLRSVDRDVLAAVAGNDLPYVRRVNERLQSCGISKLIHAPSRCTDVRAYMSEMLRHWAEAPIDRDATSRGVYRPTVSVIVTTFKPNIELLTLSLRSIIRQSYPALEIIVVDDGSPADFSGRVEACVLALERESPHPIVYLRNETNSGQYDSRNKAIGIAKGEFIAIQDDDDLSHPERISLQVEPMLRDPNVVATHAHHLRIAEEARLMVDGDVVGEIEGDAPVSFIWRRQVFDRIGGFLPTRTRGDIEFRARMARQYSEGAVLVVPQPLVLMRGGMATVSSEKEYVFRTAVRALRYMMEHTGEGDAVPADRWIPCNLR